MNFIKVTTASHVTTITLNRPEVMNAINDEMHHELQAAFDDFAADPKQHICVVTAAGERAFCAGSDLKAAVKDGHRGYPKDGYAGLTERFNCSKPIIAAVNGLAFGGGVEVAMANQAHYPAFSAWAKSEDAQEGPRAFAEKRPPV